MNVIFSSFVSSVLLVLYFSSVTSNPSGAPNAACNTMTPDHEGIPPQKSSSPYEIKLSSKSANSGGTVTITIGSKGNQKPFKGFFIQARNSRKENEPSEIIGQFNLLPVENGQQPMGQYRNCGDGTQNAVTHTSPVKKYSFSVNWTAPDDFEENVIFRSTFVQDFDNFWTNVNSEQLVAEIPEGADDTQP